MSDPFAEARRLLGACRIHIDDFKRWSLREEGGYYILEAQQLHNSGPAAGAPSAKRAARSLRS